METVDGSQAALNARVRRRPNQLITDLRLNDMVEITSTAEKLCAKCTAPCISDESNASPRTAVTMRTHRDLDVGPMHALSIIATQSSLRVTLPRNCVAPLPPPPTAVR